MGLLVGDDDKTKLWQWFAGALQLSSHGELKEEEKGLLHALFSLAEAVWAAAYNFWLASHWVTGCAKFALAIVVAALLWAIGYKTILVVEVSAATMSILRDHQAARRPPPAAGP